VNMHQFINIMRARWTMLMVMMGCIIAAAVIYSLLATKSYIAETSLVVNGGDVNAVTGVQGYQQFQPTQSTFIATQSDIITSHAVALYAVDSLKIADNASWQQAFRDDTHGTGSFRDWMADTLLQHNVKVIQSADSNVITIAIKSSDPEFAAALANEFAVGFIHVGVKLKSDAASRQAQWLDAQVAAQRAVLQRTQDRLAEYQRKADVTDAQPDTRTPDVETGRLNDLAGQLVLAQAARSDADSRMYQMRKARQSGNEGELSEVSTNPVVQTIKTELTRAAANLAQVNERFGTQHPQYLSAAAEVGMLQSRLHSEIANAVGGIRQSAEQAARREAAVNQALDMQKSRMRALRQKNDQRDVFAREVDSANLSYQTALQRSNQVSMESRLDQSGVAILSAAAVPMAPASPKILRNLLLSIVLAALIAPGIVLLLELKSRRIHGVIDLQEVGLFNLSEIPRLASSITNDTRTRAVALRIKGRSQVLLTDQLQKAAS